MRILHTADWHLGDRLGRIDRTQDLQRGVERVAACCTEDQIDVLLVAGDLFSELARPDNLRNSIQHWRSVFHDFLQSGGTVLTLTGNHDNENFCQILAHAMNLAAPLPSSPGDLVPTGRFYLATEPTLLRLPDRQQGYPVQFLLMPYPTPMHYLREENRQKYTSVEEKNRYLQAAYTDWLATLRHHSRFDATIPTVLSAHIHVRGASLANPLFRIREEDDVLVDASMFASEFDYVALGHIHRPQALLGQSHLRYSGSIERLDLGEKDDTKGVVIVEVGPQGRVGEPEVRPLPATPIYEVSVRNPEVDIPRLSAEYPNAQEDLVNLHLTYTAGVDNLEQCLHELESIFPRWYARDWVERSALQGSLVVSPTRTKSFRETVSEYLRQELMQHSEEEQAALLQRAERLMEEMER